MTPCNRGHNKHVNPRKMLGEERLTLCPHGATVLRVKGFLVHGGHGPQLSFADVDSEWYMKAMRAPTNVVVFLALLLTSLVIAQVDHALVGPRGYERHAVLGHTHQSYVLDRRFDPDGERSVVAGYRPDRAALVGGQEDPDEGAIVAAPPRRSGLGRGLYIGQRVLGCCLAIVRVRVGAREKWLGCALDRLPSSSEVGQAHPREGQRHETEAQDVLVFATAGAS